MRHDLRAFSIVAALLTCGTGVQAADYGTPLIESNSAFSVGIKNAMTAILHPLDVATQPVNDLVRPVSGPVSFGQPEPAKVVINQGDTRIGNNEKKDDPMSVIGNHDR